MTLRKESLFLVLTIMVMAFYNLKSQDVSWKPSETVKPPLQLFHSTEVVGLPTAETMQKGNIYFGITHRFVIPVSKGAEELFGFDGNVNMRISLGYAFTDDLLVTLGRSNYAGNFDLRAKYHFFSLPDDNFPIKVSADAGISYLSKGLPEDFEASRRFQYFAQLIFNTMIGKKLGIGLNPEFLYNSNVQCCDAQKTIALGMYTQYYISDLLNVYIEANPTLNGWRQYYDTYTVGFELETGGHFFKVFLTNNIMPSMSQFLAGAGDKFESGDLHIGFLISRVL